MKRWWCAYTQTWKWLAEWPKTCELCDRRVGPSAGHHDLLEPDEPIPYGEF